jgi:hypothetical protein
LIVAVVLRVFAFFRIPIPYFYKLQTTFGRSYHKCPAFVSLKVSSFCLMGHDTTAPKGMSRRDSKAEKYKNLLPSRDSQGPEGGDSPESRLSWGENFI